MDHGRANIESLPTELLVEIVDSPDLTHHDLTRLALTSKELHSFATARLYSRFECRLVFSLEDENGPMTFEHRPIGRLPGRATVIKYQHYFKIFTLKLAQQYNFDNFSSSGHDPSGFSGSVTMDIAADDDSIRSRLRNPVRPIRFSMSELLKFISGFVNLTTFRLMSHFGQFTGVGWPTTHEAWKKWDAYLPYNRLLEFVEAAMVHCNFLQHLHLLTRVDFSGSTVPYETKVKNIPTTPTLDSLQMFLCGNVLSVACKEHALRSLATATHGAVKHVRLINLKVTDGSFDIRREQATLADKKDLQSMRFPKVKRLELNEKTLCLNPRIWLGIDGTAIKTLEVETWVQENCLDDTTPTFLIQFPNLEELFIRCKKKHCDFKWEDAIPSIARFLNQLRKIGVSRRHLRHMMVSEHLSNDTRSVECRYLVERGSSMIRRISYANEFDKEEEDPETMKIG